MMILKLVAIVAISISGAAAFVAARSAPPGNPAAGLGPGNNRPAVLVGEAFARENGIVVNPIRRLRPHPLEVSQCVGSFVLVNEESLEQSIAMHIRPAKDGRLVLEHEYAASGERNIARQARRFGNVPHLLIHAADVGGPALSCYGRYLILDDVGDHDDDELIYSDILVRTDRDMTDILRERGFERGVIYVVRSCNQSGSECAEPAVMLTAATCDATRREHLLHNPGETASCIRRDSRQR